MRIGAHYSGNGRCEFVLWAPFLKTVALKIVSPQEKIFPMEKDTQGYWRTTVEHVSAQTLYLYRLEDKRERPDPASHFQPSGVHEASQVVDRTSFTWGDSGWKNIPLSEMIMYELHVGTFTPEGTFDALIPRLSEFKDLGP